MSFAKWDALFFNEIDSMKKLTLLNLYAYTAV